MRTRKLLPAAGVALALAVGVFAGSALAGGATNGPNHASAKSSANFKSTRSVRVKAAAVINANGTVRRASHLPYAVSSVTSTGTGVYVLRFSHSITGCAWVGTVGLGQFTGSTGAAQITITGRNGTKNGLYITTFDGAGTPTDEPFHVIVVC
jgi:hypothetical protein